MNSAQPQRPEKANGGIFSFYLRAFSSSGKLGAWVVPIGAGIALVLAASPSPSGAGTTVSTSTGTTPSTFSSATDTQPADTSKGENTEITGTTYYLGCHNGRLYPDNRIRRK